MKYIVIDTLGSDQGPKAILDGVKSVLENNSNIGFVVVGDPNLIEEYNLPKDRIKVIKAYETVTNYDNPVEAFYKKDKVSIFLALKEASENKDTIGVISSGATGALMVGSIKYLLDKNRTRPALAAVLPTIDEGKCTCVVDTGASIDVGPHQLVEFAHLGSEFMKKLYKIESPKVGLLSIGSESTKGNKLVKETYPLLEQEEGINFIGNIEGSKALDHLCDVLVCDGFSGNQVLKVTQGVASNLIKEIIKFGKKSGKESEAKMIAGHLISLYDFESSGAAIMLGVKKTVLKCRGSSGSKAIVSACQILINLNNNKTYFEEVFDK